MATLIPPEYSIREARREDLASATLQVLHFKLECAVGEQGYREVAYRFE